MTTPSNPRLEPSPDLAAIVAAGRIPDGGVTLDLGCGAGTDAIYLARLGYRSTAIDESAEAIAAARARAKATQTLVDWRVGSLLALPFGDRAIHFATDHGGFDSLEDADRPAYASELARVLLPGAHLLLSTLRIEEGTVLDDLFAGTFSRGPIVPYVVGAGSDGNEALLAFLERR